MATLPLQSFSEREFYLGEFRGRTIGIAWPPAEPPSAEPLSSVIAALVGSGSRVILLSPSEEILSIAGSGPPIDAEAPAFTATLWRRLRERGSAGLRVAEEGFTEACARIAPALRLAKVVWLQSATPVAWEKGAVAIPGAERAGGAERVSVVDLARLSALLEVGRGGDPQGADARALLTAIRRLIEGGVPSVNVCAPGDLERELFTYAGAGTFFTRDRYAEVRSLAIDDYDLANDLIERGEVDGFLAPRAPEARDAILAHGVGVFIEGRYLAGIGAILPYPSANAAELASLFALTRYLGEGVGGQIVRYAIDRARREGLDFVFSCTTSERVEGFFERNGFRRVASEALPAEKWIDYDPARRATLRCLRFELV